MEYNRKQPIRIFFITGLPKTGTTWCANFLNRLPNVTVVGEGRFFGGRLKNLLPLYEQLEIALSDWINFIGKRKGNWLLTDKWIVTVEKTNYIPSFLLEKKKKEIVCFLIRKLLYHLAHQVSISSNSTLVGEKTPITEESEMESWINCFNNEKFVVLTRNFIDWSVSMALHFYDSNLMNRVDRYNIWFNDEDFIHIHEYKQGKRNSILKKETLWHLAEVYKKLNSRLNQLKMQFPDRILMINYEELFFHPVKEFEKICSFLDIRVDKLEMEKAIKSVSIEVVRRGKEGYVKNHIRVAYPGKGVNFYSYDLKPFLQYVSNNGVADEV